MLTYLINIKLKSCSCSNPLLNNPWDFWKISRKLRKKLHTTNAECQTRISLHIHMGGGV